MKITLNPNEEHVAKIRAKLKANDGYCPCVLIKSDETKCMCKDFLEQTEEGYCHCQLYYKKLDD